MPRIAEDRVLETTTTTGTGALTLAGAVTGLRAFSAVMTSPSDTCYYVIEAVDGSGVPTGEWETGLGTYSARMLTEVQNGQIDMCTLDEQQETSISVTLPLPR